MEKKDLQLELDLLLANRLFSRFFDRQKCIDWAVSLMQKDYESENLYILAGLNSNDGISIEYYLERLIDDFDLSGNRNDEELFLLYVSDIARRVINKRIAPLKGLDMIENIRIQSVELDFLTDMLNPFSCLSEDISLVGEYQLFYIGLAKENIEEVIIDEMKIFLIAQSKDLNVITSLIYCKECKEFSHSKYKEKGWLLKRGGYYCEKCNSKEYLAWYNVTDRKQILTILKNYEKTI